MRIKIAVTYVIAAASLLLTAGIGTAVARPLDNHPSPRSVEVTGVDCPAEDSCDIDYRRGAWHVTERPYGTY